MILEIPIRPFPAVRSNKNSWNKQTKDYHAKMNTLRTHLLPHRQEIIDHLIYWDYTIQFQFAMAESWSKKRKEQTDGTPHDATPDIDNLCKAFFDTVFYDPITKSKDDCKIWHISASKHWGKEDKIMFISD